MRHIIAYVLFFSFVTGCAVHENVEPLTASTAYFILKDQEVFSVAGDLSAEKYVYLSSGVYQAVFESPEGFYYEGPANAIRIDRGEVSVIAEGGIYLSKTIDEPAKTWVYKNSLKRYIKGENHTHGLMTAAKSMANDTDVALQWDIPDTMKAKIHLQYKPAQN